jgi:hypothetical protein
MGSPATGAVIASGAMGALGSLLNTGDQGDLTKVNIPEDVKGLRSDLASSLQAGLPPVAPGPHTIAMPDISNPEALIKYASSPEFLTQLEQFFNPLGITKQAYALGLPAVEQGIQGDVAQIQAALGGTGNAFSTDVAKLGFEAGGNRRNTFMGNLAANLPQLYANLAGALSTVPGGLTGAGATGIAGLLQQPAFNLQVQRTPYELSLPLATAGVGGTNAALAPYYGQTSAGNFFSSGANTVALFPLLQAAMQGKG